MAHLFNADAERAKVFAGAFAHGCPICCSWQAVRPAKARYLLTWTIPGHIAPSTLGAATEH